MDRTTTKYVNRLVQRVDAVYRHLRQRCDLPALPTLPKRANAQTEQQHNEKPKLLQQMRELNAPQAKGAATTKQQQQQQAKATTKAATATATKTTTTTTTTTTAAKPQQQRTLKEAKATTTKTSKVEAGTGTGTATGTGNAGTGNAGARKKRKMIVFESDDMGVPIARVEYH